MYQSSFCFLQVFTDFSLNLGCIRGTTFLFAFTLQFQYFLFTWLIFHLDLRKSKIIQGMQSGSILELRKAFSCTSMISKNGLKEEYYRPIIYRNQLSTTPKMKMRIQSSVNFVVHRKLTECTIAVLAKDVFTKWIIIVRGQATVSDILQSSHFFFFFSM